MKIHQIYKVINLLDQKKEVYIGVDQSNNSNKLKRKVVFLRDKVIGLIKCCFNKKIYYQKDGFLLIEYETNNRGPKNAYK